jgi:hypothetical protein
MTFEQPNVRAGARFSPTARWIELGVCAAADPSKAKGEPPFSPWSIDPLKSFLPQARRELAKYPGAFAVSLASILPAMMARKLGTWPTTQIEIGLDLCRAAGIDGYALLAKRILRSDTILTKSESERKAIIRALLRAMVDLCSMSEARAVVVALLSSRVRNPDLAPAALSALTIIDSEEWVAWLLLLQDELEAYFYEHSEGAFIETMTELMDRVAPDVLAMGLLDERLSDRIKSWLFATRVRLRADVRPKAFLEMLLKNGEYRPGAEQLWRNLEIEPDTGAPMNEPRRIAPDAFMPGRPDLLDRWTLRARALHVSVNTLKKNRMPWQTEIVDFRRMSGELFDQSKTRLVDFIQST